MATPPVPPIVDAEWLESAPRRPILADVRWYLDERSGLEAFRAGHIPGARFVDLDRWLAGPPSPAAGRHPLPDPEVFAEGMRRAGISDDSVVVAYDDAGGVMAARLVWMLRATGHPAALLNGGLAAWEGPLQAGERHTSPGVFTPVPWPAERLASIEDVAARRALVVDARTRARYRGEDEALDPRAGHIPGAVSLPCRENLDPSGRLLPAAALRRRFEAAGVREGVPVICSCGSGITACHNLLTLEWAGLAGGRLYPGSWSQWSSDPARPIAVGDEPG